MIRKPSITNKLILASSVLLFSFNTFSQSLTIVSMGLDGGRQILARPDQVSLPMVATLPLFQLPAI